jgi:predicted XRE-type DNA-binding protein
MGFPETTASRIASLVKLPQTRLDRAYVHLRLRGKRRFELQRFQWYSRLSADLRHQSGKLDACGEWNRGGDRHHRLTETLEAKIKADIWQALMKHIEQHGFSQAYLVTKLKAHQPDVSNLLKGKISKVSITKLIQFASRLNLDARVKVSSPKEGRNIATLRASSPKSSRCKRELIHA